MWPSTQAHAQAASPVAAEDPALLSAEVQSALSEAARLAAQTRRNGMMIPPVLMAVALPVGGSPSALPAEPAQQLAQNTTIVPLRPDQGPRAVSPPRDVEIIIPLSERGSYLGDLPVIIVNNEPRFEAVRIAELLKDIASPSALDRLRAAGNGGRITIADLNTSGLQAVWDPGQLSIDVTVSASDKESRDIEVSERDRVERGRFIKPAAFAVYANFRSSLDYVHQGFDTGLQDPFIDSTIGGRILGTAFENEVTWDTGTGDVRRNASRLIWDFEKAEVRVVAGDIRPPSRGYQSSSELLGISIFSAQQTLAPYRNVQPRGEGRFSLNESSNVDVLVNGRVVRRLRLDSGSYNLTDFPFLSGENRVEFIAEDRTGRRELAKFDVFFDLQLLAPGLSEWAISAGETTSRGRDGIQYGEGDNVISGFYRRGMSNTLTLGGGLQVEGERNLASIDAIWAAPYGIISWDFANSWGEGDSGQAGSVTFQRSAARSSELDRVTWGFAASGRSARFGVFDARSPDNAEAARVSAFWGRTLTRTSSLSMDAGYVWGGPGFADSWTARVGYGQRLTSSTGLSADLNYSRNRLGEEVAFRVQFTMRLGRSASYNASLDTRDDRFGLSYQQSGQTDFGSWAVNGDMDRTTNSSGLNAAASLSGSKGDVSLAHSTAFRGDFGSVTDQRTSLRLSAGVGFADGSLAWGKPIFGAFAIVRPHPTLQGRRVLIDSTSRGGGLSSSRLFGPVLISDLPTYTRRDLRVDVDDLPAGYDLGTGVLSVRAPVGAGYNLRVGSDNNLTVLATAQDSFGDVISFIAGKAERADGTDQAPIELFTNGVGVFSVSGLGPGNWKITFNTSPDPTVLRFSLPKEGGPLRRLGTLKGETP